MVSNEDSNTEENNAECEVPTKYLNFNLNMKTEESYFRVINMLSYWQVTDIPFSVLDSIRDNILDIRDDLLDNVYYLMILQYIHLDIDDLIRYSIDNKNQNLYNYTYILQEKNFGKPYVPLAHKILEIKYIILKFVEEDMGVLSPPNLEGFKQITDKYYKNITLLLFKLKGEPSIYYNHEDLSKKDIKKIVNPFNVKDNYMFIQNDQNIKKENCYFFVETFTNLCLEFYMKNLGTDKIEYDGKTKTIMYTQSKN